MGRDVMAKVSPQRIIAEAIELLGNIDLGVLPAHEAAALEERISNNVQELEGLSRALYRDGINSIGEG